ncbi:MAG TPA: sensor histidine kinase [Thermoleophilaceae bacterium]|nr:sensor histidine kinase [Thermoleophilaceae bacterium]
MRHLRRLTATTALDIALVLFVAVTTVTHVYDDSDPSTHIAGPRWLALSLPLLIALPLLWRRTRPLLVCALVLGGIVVHAIVSGHSPEGVQFILIWVVVPYSVAAYSDRRGALIGLAIVLAAFAVYALENDDIMSGRTGDLWAGAFFLILAIGAWLAGTVMRGRREAAALHERAAALEREAELAGADERARVARDLHDIVSHNLSVVVVQAAGARAQAETREVDPGTLEKIERSGREALAEMRRLLGVMREDQGADKAALRPNPGLAELPALAERVRGAGVAVDLRVEVNGNGVPPAIDLSAYRIVQEALTNTLKHAGPEARARVVVRPDGDTLLVEVADDGGLGGADSVAEGGGHGLVGMHERAQLLGGQLDAGPRPGGGFIVTARLPLTPAGT